jgi:hypothetical protein
MTCSPFTLPDIDWHATGDRTGGKEGFKPKDVLVSIRNLIDWYSFELRA